MITSNAELTKYLLCGGLYWSSVQVHGSLAAPELVPIAALVIASPTVNCSSTCLALREKKEIKVDVYTNELHQTASLRDLLNWRYTCFQLHILTHTLVASRIVHQFGALVMCVFRY